MPEIEVTLRNFTLFQNEARVERFRYIELIKAAITAGHKKGDVLQDGLNSVLQAIERVATIRRSLAPGNNRIYSSTHYRNNVGATEKGKISNSVGNAVCGMLAERIAQVPWMMNLETYEEKIDPTFLPVGQRPDYVGRSLTNQWFVFEAKGRTSSPKSAEIRDWKAQSAAITHIGGVQVACGLASVALIDGSHELEALWDDPDPVEFFPSGRNLKLTTEQYFRLYFGPVVALIDSTNLGLDTERGRLSYFPEVDIHIGLHRHVRKCLESGDFDFLDHFAQSVILKRGAVDDSEEMLFPDGLILKLGPTWRDEVGDDSPIQPLPLPHESTASPKRNPWPLNTISPYAIRDELTAMVVKDLLGPAEGLEEELDQREDHAFGRYLVGLLAPQSAVVEGEVMDSLGTDGADDPEVGSTEAATSAKDSFFPSTIGISFMVEVTEEAIVIQSHWARYRRVKSERQVKKVNGEPALVWKREPHEGEPLVLPLKAGLFGPYEPDPTNDPLVVLQGKVRKNGQGWLVTVFLRNISPKQDRKKDEAWVFQPKVRARSAGRPARPVFLQRHDEQRDFSRMDAITREEAETLEMLYRFRPEFAVGHGCSVHATLLQPDAVRATAVETEFIPQAEVEQQTPPDVDDNPDIAGVVLDMKELAEMQKADLLASLNQLHSAYSNWIIREALKPADPTLRLQHHQDAAARAIASCRRACDRLREGIDLIDADPIAEESFRFANRAMWHQRMRSTYSRLVRKKKLLPGAPVDPLDIPKNRSWRVFQLAFVIINLPGLTRLDHEDRIHETDAVADLLWFATGGGKTEAYLGLTAYTLALRRLQGEIEGRRGDHGIAVLMRYTLRLLTLQQFQRAAALICACETIRRADIGKWGTVPFRLGLWVGSKATPNSLKSAAEALRQGATGGRPTVRGTPHQLISCPWCGREIREHHIKVYEGTSEIGRCVTYCSDATGGCEFSEAKAPREGLPVMVVDEEIYRRPPSLLIATVDKFAQMPWKGEVQHLFGQVSGLCERHGFLSPEVEKNDTGNHQAYSGQSRVSRQDHAPLRPPDLIIQDELHLISGPLGSMVALYETAVDELCTWTVNGKRVRPKVVSSTATIRRAGDQIKKTFLRKVEVFPPQGTSIDDSFFSLRRHAGEQYPGRRYLGICALGRRYPVAIIRVYTALMGAAQALYVKYDNLADPWMTLAGYFNSIRELAGTRRLVEDDIRSRLRDADERGLAKRRIRSVEELTSRKSGTDIPGILERLETVFDLAQDAQREADRKAGNRPLPPPYDVMLATNMISVGVDIERLGLMVVAGQPKTTSEYIQASSRVGRSRSGPGLVVTVFNWARPRDLSHFETFEHYHDTFYKHVEALSVTPFSAPALKRGLAGILVGMMRLYDQHLNANEDAGKLSDTDPEMPWIMQRIINRAEKATGDPSVGVLVRQMLEERRDKWLSLVHNQHDYALGYKDGPGGVIGLLKETGAGQWEEFTCLNSLRDVEGTVNLILDPNTAGLRVAPHLNDQP